MKFIITENQYKLFISENYDPIKEFLESREGRVIVSIPNQKNPKDPNSCKVLRYATQLDQKFRLDPKNPSNLTKSEEYTLFCYTKGDLANKIKIFDKGLGSQQLKQDSDVTSKGNKVEIDAFNLLRDFTTQMTQKLNSGGYSTSEYCVNPCYVSKNGQFWKFLDEIKNTNQDIDETKPKYVSVDLIRKYACINKNVLSSYQDFKKDCGSDVLPILSKEFNCNSIDDCRNKINFYLKNFYIEKEKNLSELIVEYRHGILNTLSLVSALIPLAGPILSLTFDVANAAMYYKEGDKYTAGLTLILGVIPAAQLSQYGIKATNTLIKGVETTSMLAKEGKLTEDILVKTFTKQDLKSLEGIVTHADKLISSTSIISARKLMIDKLAKIETQDLLKWAVQHQKQKTIFGLIGSGIAIGGSWFSWSQLSKKYQISDKSEQKQIEEEVQKKFENLGVQSVLAKQTPEEQQKHLEHIKQFDAQLESKPEPQIYKSKSGVEYDLSQISID